MCYADLDHPEELPPDPLCSNCGALAIIATSDGTYNWCADCLTDEEVEALGMTNKILLDFYHSKQAERDTTFPF